jgi:hypothetical protein
MEDAKPLKLGEPCPGCGGELKAARVPTDEQRRRFEDREQRQPLPANTDTMSAQGRTDHGALYRCHECGYAARFPLSDVDTKGKQGKGKSADSPADGATA